MANDEIHGKEGDLADNEHVIRGCLTVQNEDTGIGVRVDRYTPGKHRGLTGD
jgi:hypothetical protein